MFAHSISFRRKPNSMAGFTRVNEEEALPLLRKQEGFQDEITFVAPGGEEVVAISLWHQKENAESYSRHGYPDVLKALANLLDRAPQVRTYEVSNSTFHKIAARVAA